MFTHSDLYLGAIMNNASTLALLLCVCVCVWRFLHKDMLLILSISIAKNLTSKSIW